MLTRRALLALPLPLALRAEPRWRAEEVRRFPANEANQAVVAGPDHYYAIGNHIVGKYEKKTGKRVGGWECERGKPLIHLNSGILQGGVLYGVHSNYPELPMVSSIEMWDTRTMRHTGSHSFGVYGGSATWLDFYKGSRYVHFAHYGNRAADPGRDSRWTQLVKFDSEWRPVEGWVYPAAVIAKLGQYSISGGVFAPDGAILCTGHDNPEIHVVRFPEGGSTLVYEETFPTTIPGQAISWDPVDPALLYGIDRARREIVVTKISPPTVSRQERG